MIFSRCYFFDEDAVMMSYQQIAQAAAPGLDVIRHGKAACHSLSG